MENEKGSICHNTTQHKNETYRSEHWIIIKLEGQQAEKVNIQKMGHYEDHQILCNVLLARNEIERRKR